MKYFVFMLLIVGFAGIYNPLYAQVPQCRQISMDHFGGNLVETMPQPWVVSHSNGTFSMIISSNSTTGSIRTDCNTGTGGGLVFRTYTADYSALLGQTCGRKGQDFTWAASFVYPLSNGDTVLIGQSELQSGDLGIEKRDAAGNLVWNKHYGGTGFEKFITAVPGPDGGYFLAGDAHSGDGDVGLHHGNYFDRDIWIVKVDSNGNKIWARVLGGTREDIISAVIPMPDGGCYLFGETASNDYDVSGLHGSNNGDIYIARLDSLGNKLWHRCYGGTKGDGTGDLHATMPIKDGKGGFYIAASTQSTDGDVQRRQPDGFDMWAFHIDSVGTLLWENTFGGPGWDFMRAFCLAADGSLWIGGSTEAAGGQVPAFYGMKDAWVVHIDTAGNFINSRTLGADKEEFIYALYPLADASVLAIGNYFDYITSGSGSPGFPEISEGSADIFVARLGPDNDLAITDVLPPDSWELFPNPPNGQLTIRTKTGANGKYRARILDAAGRAIYKHSFRRELKVATGGWQPGIYIVELQDEDGKSGTKKINIP